MSATCIPWYMLRGTTGWSKHGEPMFPHFCPMNQNLARVRTWGGGVIKHAICAPGRLKRSEDVGRAQALGHAQASDSGVVIPTTPDPHVNGEGDDVGQDLWPTTPMPTTTEGSGPHVKGRSEGFHSALWPTTPIHDTQKVERQDSEPEGQPRY